MNVLDLFSGIGGFSLGLERAGFKTVAFCEIEPYPRKVLAKHWPKVPIYEDVRRLTAKRLADDGITGIDVITGGFPCQDISVAGKQAGIGEGTRSGLWSEIARLISELRPRYAFMENVTALISGDRGRWFGRVLGDLAEIGYDAEWHCIPASELGAHHHRDRVWIIGYPNSHSQPTSTVHDEKSVMPENDANTEGQRWNWPGPETYQSGRSSEGSIEGSGVLAYPVIERRQGPGKSIQWSCETPRINRQAIDAFAGSIGEIWRVESQVGRVVDGIPNRSHRLKGLGNAVVPQIPELIGRAIMEYEQSQKGVNK